MILARLYLRASTDEQDASRARAALQAEGQARAKAAGRYQGRREDTKRTASIAAMRARSVLWSQIQRMPPAAAGRLPPKSPGGRGGGTPEPPWPYSPAGHEHVRNTGPASLTLVPGSEQAAWADLRDRAAHGTDRPRAAQRDRLPRVEGVRGVVARIGWLVPLAG